MGQAILSEHHWEQEMLLAQEKMSEPEILWEIHWEQGNWLEQAILSEQEMLLVLLLDDALERVLGRESARVYPLGSRKVCALEALLV